MIGYKLIDYNDLADNPYQQMVRGQLDPGHVQRLALNIRAAYDQLPDQLGLRELPQVRRCLDNGHYEVIDGHHRIAACQLLATGDGGDAKGEAGEPLFPGPDSRWAKMPCILAGADDGAMFTATLDTSIKKGLDPIGLANGFHRLTQAPYNMTQKQIGERYGYSQPAVANLLRLRQLPRGIKKLIAGGVLGEAHGRALLPLLKLPGVLEEFAAQHGRGLWTTECGYVGGIVGPLPGSETLYLVNVRSVTDNVSREILRRTRDLEALRWRDGTPWPGDWVPYDDDLAEIDPPAHFVSAELVEEISVDLSPYMQRSCDGCEHVIVHKKERRCLNPTCHELHKALWAAHLANEQLPAVRAWCEEHGVPEDRIILNDSVVDWNWRYHGNYDAPRELFDGGRCGAGVCDCFRVVFRLGVNERDPNLVKPGGDFYAMCSSPQRLAARKRALAHEEGVDLARYSWEVRDNAYKRAMAARRKRFVRTIDGSTDFGEFAHNADLLKLIDDAVNRPNGWGEDSQETDPAKLWATIVNGLLRGIPGHRHNKEFALEWMDRVIRSLGGELDGEDLDGLARIEGDMLVERAAGLLDSRNLDYSIGEMGQLAVRGLGALTPDKRERLLHHIQEAREKRAGGLEPEHHAELDRIVFALV